MRRAALACCAWLAAGCATRAPAPGYAVTGLRLSKPLGSCLARALGSAESATYLGPLREPGAQVERLRLYTSPVTPAHFVDVRVLERGCSDGTAYLELSAEPAGTSYDAEPEILELRLDSIAEHIASICRAKVISFERGRWLPAPTDTCAP